MVLMTAAALLPVPPLSAPPEVLILLAVYNGARDLPDQLRSIAEQEHRNWHLLVSDDGSSDASGALLAAFQTEMASEGRQVTLLTGPGRGAGENFLSLLRHVAQMPPAERYIAFCDQDDVWLSDRLSRGLQHLQAAACPTVPLLYCSRTWITDAALQGRRLSPARPRPPGFRNALVQNICGGNTVLLNPVASQLLTDASCEIAAVIVHDWWAYLIITGAGGQVLHDDQPTLLYRQHPENQIGANDSQRARLLRIYLLLKGVYSQWNDVNMAALTAVSHRLSPTHRAEFEAFCALRRARLPGRLRGLHRLNLYRQSRISTFALWVAAILGRL
jgi:glycosyltransferase involved in cell wall biosynthesis